MKIVLFWDYYGPYHFARAKGLRAAAAVSGHEVVLLELANRSATYAWTRVEPAPVPDLITLFRGEVAEEVSNLRAFRAIRLFLQVHRIDVLMVPSYWPGYVVAATRAARSCDVRVVIMAESHYASGRNAGVLIPIKRWLVGQYDAALVGGSSQRVFFRYLGMPEDRIFDGYDVVDNGYFAERADAARAGADAWRKTLQLPPRYILSLGRLVPKKNLEMLVRAYAIAVAKRGMAGVHLLFVGSGSESENLKALATSLGLPVIDRQAQSGPAEPAGELPPHAVHFHPFVQIDRTPVYFALAECFVLVSKSEEWGLVVNEAMASGCAVIVSGLVGACFDLVESGETGFRVSPANPDELAWYLHELSRKPDLRRRLAAAGYRRILEWGPGRFGRNGVLAAEAALGLHDERNAAAKTADGMLRPIILLQTSFPDYRIPVYAGLRAAVGPAFQLRTGMDYFTPDVRTCSEFRNWIHIIKNVFLLRRALLWQRAILPDALAARIVIVELNPRILSNWIILGMRALWDRPTLIWGHAWGREGPRSLRNVTRLLMMRLASGVITYTHTQRAQLARLGLFKHLYTAPNSLMSKADCRSAEPSVDELNVILFVGRLNPSKCPRLLLEAFMRVHTELPPHVELLFVGSGAEREPLEQLARDSGVAPRVRFVGHINDTEILRSYYARAFCAVSPGYVGLSAIQSFSFGVPMVIADKANHAPEIEACQEGENTVFFEADNPKALGAALTRMYRERDAWLGRRTRIAQWTGAHYSTDAMVEAFTQAIADAEFKAKDFS